MRKNFIEAFRKIKQSRQVLLVIHDRPDGDALAAVSALMELLNDLEKKNFAFCPDNLPSQFNFLLFLEKINTNKKQLHFSQYDLIIALDCGNLSRTNIAEEIKNKNSNQFIIEFDHHPQVDNYADISLRDARASSTAEVLYNFFKANKIKISKNTANCILTGILTDTGNFLYPSTTDKTIKIAAEMMICGAKLPLILESAWRNKSLPAMKIWGMAINNLQINKKYNFAFSVLTQADISQSQATEEELEGISGFLSNLYGVRGVVLLREEEGNKIKGSLRTSHPKTNVAELAWFLGGGGHKKASGFIIDGRIKKISTGWKII